VEIEIWPIDRPKDYEKNARKWSDASLRKFAKSIEEFGWRQPLVVDTEGVICIGHFRRAAGKLAGFTTCPVHVATDLTPAQIRKLRLADNRLHEEADWDLEKLTLELGEMQALEIDLETTGFSASEIDRTVGARKGQTDENAVPVAPAQPVATRGDVWLLGGHRLTCGDCTVAADVARVMRGERADMVFTDPPYGVGYDGGTTIREKLQGDDSTALYLPCCQMAATHSHETAALYLWHAGVKGIAAAAAAAAAAAGYEIRCEIVWNKNLAQFGALSAQYKQKHEPCYYCFRLPPKWYGPTNETTVWDCPRSAKNDFHPTQKPVELAQRAMQNSTKPGEIVLDLFLGSGSTLIAAETLDRRCYGVEIDPKYVDVDVQRWQDFTGQHATLEGDGRTFAQVKLDRLAVRV